MKTKDFIKMLQEADPEGEGYVRLPCDGAIYCAHAKEGYWDGAYQYIENFETEKGYKTERLITSTQGYKVDVGVLDMDSIIWEEDGDLERIKERIRFDLTYINNDDKINSHWKYIEKEAEFVRERHKKSVEEWTIRTVDNYFSGGYEIRQPLDKKIGYYNCMRVYTSVLGFDIKKGGLCQGECMAIIESGKFYPEKKEKYYIWHYDPEKGKNWSLK